MRVKMERCDHCGSVISERQITLFKGMVWALWKTYQWCKEHNTDTFQRKQIKALFKNENETARFGDWIYFGNLVEKPHKGTYRLNFGPCERFFAGKEQIPASVWKNPTTGELRVEELRYVRDVKGLSELLDTDLMYITNYH